MMASKNSNYPPGNTSLIGGGLRGRRGMTPVVKPKNFKATVSRLWRYFGVERKRLFMIFALIATSSGLGLLVPFIIGKSVDAISPGKTSVDLDLLGVLVLILSFTYVLDAVMNFLQGYIMAGISQRIIFRLRSALFSKLQKLPIAFFDTHSHGEVMSRLANDIDNVSITISQSTTQLMSGSISIVGAFIMMLVLSPILTIASIITLPMVFLLTNSIAKKTKILFKEQQISLGRLNGQIEESISGIQEILAFNQQEKVIKQFAEINDKLCDVGIKAQVWSGYIMPLMNVINNIGFSAVAGVGGVLAVKGIVTIGIIASFLSYSRQFARPLNDLANIFNTLQSAVAGAERVFEILDEVEESKDLDGAGELEGVKGEVIFKNVTFGYRVDVPIIKNINFHIKPGTTIALVGPTGAGKTTIVNLLTRFYDVLGGEILIDCRNIKEYTRDSLRRCFGIVLQDTYLFSGTIKENIRYGNLNASDRLIENAAEMANADHFIKRLPYGYNTLLTEGGMNLSQGQRQLLAISRAILSDPSILILDEATSSIDTRTEFKIQEAMLKIMNGRTSFIIAHRLSTIKDADIIMVIDDGQIVESGSHNELMNSRGHYYKLYERQFKNMPI